ncbi:T9SS type A sorting domain-containing protein [Saprospiraceae bacterium]|nr:T9SS type A sorting domain-containing protein [Saprospiraceae bacterium]
MRKTLSFFFLCIFYLQTSFSQVYFLDSTATLSFFEGTGGSVFTEKYHYDEQLRILQINNEFQTQTYEYYNQYDHSIVNGSKDGLTFYGKVNKYYTSEGLLHTHEYELYDTQSQQFQLSNRLKYEYDQDDNILEETRFSYSPLGQESISSLISYLYSEGNLVNKVEQSYSGGTGLTLTRITEWEYENELLVLETQELVAGFNQSSYIKTYEYNSDNTIASYQSTHFNQMDSSYEYVGSYEYTDQGVHQIEDYNILDGSPYTQTLLRYRSYVESPFYEQDSFLSSSIFDGQEFTSESRFNSEHYSPNGDSVLVRRESRQTDSQIGTSQTIIKEFHIILPENPSEIIDEEAIAAHIFPNPVKAGSSIIIQKVKDEVDRGEIYNILGQKIDDIFISTDSQIVANAPKKTGNYYVLYYDDDQRVGQIGKFVVK